MSITYDFQIVGSNISGISLVLAQNEDAFSYLVDEAHMTVFSDGTAALFNERVGDFISDAEHAHMCCNYVWSTNGIPMHTSLATAALIGLLSPLSSFATPTENSGCYSTNNGGYVCHVQVAPNIYSVAYNHPRVNLQYPTVFYIECTKGGNWKSYGPLTNEYTPVFAEAFCKVQNEATGNVL